MSKPLDNDKPEFRNWLKQWRAVYVTRQALLPIVSAEATQLHGDILHKTKVPACTSCSFIDVEKRTAKCPYHNVLRDELVDEHAYGHVKYIGALTLKNTKTENWAHSPWEIAKVFMPPSGYENKTTIEETDFNGIAGFIINCKRFQGNIAGSICEKAREVVNNIRTMPDVSSCFLTDQATTECIDKLYALLNEPGLQTKPEAIQARAQLDELKTAVPSKDENAYNFMYKELHDEFQQNRADIEMNLQLPYEADTKIAKEHLSTESEQVFQALEHFSNDTMYNLSKTQEDLILSIKEERRRVLDHIEFRERKATEQIEQFATAFKGMLKDETERLAKRLRKEEVENLQQKKLELKTRLIKHYKISSSQITVRLNIDETIEKIYEDPKLTLKKYENGMKIETDISELSQLFSTRDGPFARTIIVEGEPGKGKTTLCKKIVDDWRKVNEQVEQEPITPNSSNFAFVFYIILRLVKTTESEVKAMIVEHILKKIDSDYSNAHSLLAEILKSEHCLILFDGLDEWHGGMPQIETSWTSCTALFTTRPYKLTELKLIPTQIDKHVILDGVQKPGELVLKVIRKLEEYHKTNKQPESCVEDLEDKQLWHFSKNPVVLVHIVWLWQRNKLRKFMSRSTLYKKIIDERWHEMCAKNELDKDPSELYNVLSDVAFYKLLSKNEDKSLVFNIKGILLEKFKQYKDESLESGILSASNVPGERFPQYQFLHKTFQEYLAAVFLSKRGSDLSSSCKLVKEIYSNHRNESVFALEQVFLFLCGLNQEAAEEFSKTLNELFTMQCEKEGSAKEASKFQKMMLSGYNEAERSGQKGAEFSLQHIDLDKNINLTEHQMSKLKLCLEDKRKSSLVSLRISKESDIFSALHYSGNPTILDLKTCKNLKFVALKRSYEDINQLNVNALLECEIEFKEFKPACKLISSVQSSDLRGLKSLTLINVGLECEAVDILSKLKCVKVLDLTWSKTSRPNNSQLDPLDIGHLEYLEELSLNELDVSDVVNLQMLNLRKLEIGFRTQQQAPKLKATLLSKHDGSLTTFLDGSHVTLKDLRLKNVRMIARVCMRLLSMMLQSGQVVKCTFNECTIDGDIRDLHEEVGNQTALQVEAPWLVLPNSNTITILEKVTMSADLFMRLVVVVLRSGQFVGCTVTECSVEGDIRDLHEEAGNQTALQVVAPQQVSPFYVINIKLEKVTMSADVFLRLVLVLEQSVHCMRCTFIECTIEGEIRDLQQEKKNQTALQVVAPQPASLNFSKRITLRKLTMTADVFRRIVLVVLQSGQYVSCMFIECTIKGDIRQPQEEVGNQTALQVVVPQPDSPHFTKTIILMKVTMTADVFRRLVLEVVQSGQYVRCTITECTIEGDIRDLHAEVENQTALQPVIHGDGFSKCERGWFIGYKSNILRYIET